jgi:glycosyltransferase involved in cell wall biosynthesis
VVIPVANVAVPPVEPDPGLVAELTAAKTTSGHRWLSVGRLAPNKAHHQTIAALFVARATYDPDAQLTLVGSPTEPAYAAALHRYAAALGLAGSVDFVAGIPATALAAYYRCADVLVMLSDHEGFGVPLVEAMAQGLPIVAFDAGAVREVLGDAGVLLDDKQPRAVAEGVATLMANDAERARLVAAGRSRFDALDLGRAAEQLVDAVRDLSGAVAGAR